MNEDNHKNMWILIEVFLMIQLIRELLMNLFEYIQINQSKSILLYNFHQLNTFVFIKREKRNETRIEKKTENK